MSEIERSREGASPERAALGPAGAAVTGHRQGRWLAYALVSALSLTAGIGGTWFVLRWMTGTPAGGPSTAGGPEGHGAMSAPPSAGSGEHAGLAGMDEGAGGVYISPARQQLIGVRTTEVGHRALETTIRTVGTLAYDETRVAQIHTKIAGWVDRVFVNYVGKRVRRGQPLFTVYSPELVSTQNEYLLALEAQQRLGQSRFLETRAGAESLLAATRARLKLWDISDDQIAELERTRQPRRTLTLYSPFDGIVLERNAYPGQYITPETMTFKIADLSTIWVFGYVFEYELPMVRVGQEAEIQFPYGQASRTLKGKITYVYPDVDPVTRRVKIRIEFRNPGFEFKPESYVTVVIRTSGGRQLAIPKEAVIDTGAKRYVILAHPNGYFEPREVEVGQPVDEYYPVLKGLQPGDRVVTSAQFLIDSETNLQAAMQAMAGMHAAPEAAPAAGAGEHAGHAPAGPAGTPGPGGAGPAAPAPAPRVAIAFRSQPDPPRRGENTFEVVVRGADGQPVTDASVEVVLAMPPMPSMGTPAMRSRAVLAHAGGGVYRGTGEIGMAGRWDVTVTVSRGGRPLARRSLVLVVP